MMESQDEAASFRSDVWQFRVGMRAAYFYILNPTDMEKFSRLMKFLAHYDSTAPTYRTVYQLSRGCYTSENEIVRYSRAGVVVVTGDASRCSRDSTRNNGGCKVLRGSFRRGLKLECFELCLKMILFFNCNLFIKKT